MKKIHLEKLTVVQLVKQLSVSENQKFLYRVFTRLSLIPISGETNLFRNLVLHYFNIRFNILFKSKSRPFLGFLLLNYFKFTILNHAEIVQLKRLVKRNSQSKK
jgi:hypothetical protein